MMINGTYKRRICSYIIFNRKNRLFKINPELKLFWRLLDKWYNLIKQIEFLLSKHIANIFKYFKFII